MMKAKGSQFISPGVTMRIMIMGRKPCQTLSLTTGSSDTECLEKQFLKQVQRSLPKAVRLHAVLALNARRKIMRVITILNPHGLAKWRVKLGGPVPKLRNHRRDLIVKWMLKCFACAMPFHNFMVCPTKIAKAISTWCMVIAVRLMWRHGSSAP